MSAPMILLFLFGTNIIKGAVILRDGSLGEFPLELLEEPTKLSSISMTQNYENTFSSGVSSSSSFATNGLPQYLHQGNNLFIRPQFQLSGSASPTIAAVLIPIPSEKLIADCDQKALTTEEPPKYEEPEKPKEPENHEALSLVPQLDQEILNDSTEKESIVIPAPPELPPMDLPELPVPVDIPNIDQTEKEDNDKITIKPVNDELPSSSEQSISEDSKPIVIPQPPELPSLALPELPIKVIDQIAQSPAHPLPCEKPTEVIAPAKPEYEMATEQEPSPPIPMPPVPVSTSNENNIINNESAKLENNIISFPEKYVPRPIIISVVPNYPQIPLEFPQLPVPQFPSNVGLPNMPADVPPCPPQFPHNSLLQVHDYVNPLGPQYQVVPVSPYKK